MNEIPTPRTDNIRLTIEAGDWCNEKNCRDFALSHAELLEKELHLANQQVEELKKDLSIMTSDRNGVKAINEKHRQQITKLEAACAEKNEALKEFSSYRNYNYNGRFNADSPLFDACSFADKALNSTTCGNGILEENKETEPPFFG